MPIPTSQAPMVRTTARERVFKELRQWIINGTLLPQERLNDVELARHFGVSRTPVREALQMLSEQKLVTMVPSSGTFVASIDLEDMAYVYEVLEEMKAYALELSFARIGQGELEQLRQINGRLREHERNNDVPAMIGEDWAFHHCFTEWAANPYLTNYTEQLMSQAHRSELRFFRNCARRYQSCEGHAQIIQALEKKDLAQAKEKLRQNWRISLQE